MTGTMRLTLPLLVVAAAGPTRAQTPLPTGKQVFDRYVETIGGRDAIAKQTARWIWGRFDIPSQGIKGPIQIAAAAPDRLYTHVEIPGIGTSTSGFDGETGWAMNPAMGPMLMDGMALNQLRQQADFHSALHPERYVAAMDVVAEVDFDGRGCYQVKVRTTWGEEYTEYFDRTSGLLVGAVRKQSTPMGELEATTTVDDYQLYGGVKVPRSIRLKTMGIEQVIQVDSVSVAPIPDSVFALPAAIRALKKPT